MAAPLAAVLGGLNAEVFVTISKASHSVEKILRKNSFLASYGYGALEDNNHTTLPFQRISLSDTTSFSKYLSSHMNGKGIPLMSPSLEKAFRKSIFEIFQNCVTHSGGGDGIFVCGQYYPQLHHLDLTIADTGIGIRTNVRRYLRSNEMSSVEAIRWALQQGNTTKIGNQPGGMGLKLLSEFITINGGKIQIASRQGFYQFAKGKEHFVKLTSDLPGTTVNLEINTNDTRSYQLSSDVITNRVF